MHRARIRLYISVQETKHFYWAVLKSFTVHREGQIGSQCQVRLRPFRVISCVMRSSQSLARLSRLLLRVYTLGKLHSNGYNTSTIDRLNVTMLIREKQRDLTSRLGNRRADSITWYNRVPSLSPGKPHDVGVIRSFPFDLEYSRNSQVNSAQVAWVPLSFSKYLQVPSRVQPVIGSVEHVVNGLPRIFMLKSAKPKVAGKALKNEGVM